MTNRSLFRSIFETNGLFHNGSKILRNDDDYKVYLSVPGLTKDDIKITAEDDLLVISFDRNEPTDKIVFVESFQKSYYIPEDVDTNMIEAKVINGILEIVLPKTQKKKNKQKLIPVS